MTGQRLCRVCWKFIKGLALDKRQLAERNKRLTEFQHRLTRKEEFRRELLEFYASLPAPRQQKPIPGTFLIIRPDHIGDNLLTTPSMVALAKATPRARRLALVGDWSSSIMAAYPEVHQVFTLPFPGFTRARKESLLQPYIRAWQWSHKVRQLRAEVAIIMRPDHWWGALLAYMAGIPARVGYDKPEVAPFLTRAIPFARGHVVRQCLRLVEPWTGVIPDDQVEYRFPINDEDRDFIKTYLQEYGVRPDTPIVVIHPGAGTPIKRWDSEQWSLVADRLAVHERATIIFTGSDAEYPQIARIMAKMKNRAVSLAGETTVGQLAALYARARVVIGSDSGPLHLAVASGAPTVTLYGPADPDEFGPWGNPARQVVVTSGMGCAPCRILDWPGDHPSNHPCIRDITPRQVIEAAFRAMNSK